MTATESIVITLDSKRTVDAWLVEALHTMNRGGPVHYLMRTLLGSPGNVFQMPLCWHAHQQERGGTDDEWWLSVDHGSIDLARHFGSYDRELVTCSDCIEWLRA